MHFTGHTPESLLPRSDSKNPATTCKGITSSGRPCRRNLKATKSTDNNGVLAVVSVDGDDGEGAAAFFCWQHKDQAEKLAAGNNTTPQRTDTKLFPLQERSSIDTLVQRLGVLEVEDPKEPSRPQDTGRRKERRDSSGRPPRRINRPPTWEQVQGPLLSVPEDVMASGRRPAAQKPASSRPPPRPRKQQGLWEALCCGDADDDYVEVVRHKKRTENPPYPVTSQYGSEPPLQMPSYPQETHPLAAAQAERPRPRPRPRPSGGSSSRPVSQSAGNSIPARTPLGEKPARPLNKTTPSGSSQTTTLLSYIPKTLPPQSTSLLLTELSKPISPYDDEGYIYIFWLTSESAGPPPSTAATSLLTPPSRPEQGRRTSDLLRQYSVRSPQRPSTSRAMSGDSRNVSASEKQTILLKIGRANNVHRRMTEWTRQCGYELSLVRWYPYVSSTPSPSPSPNASPTHSRPRSNQNTPRPSDPLRRVSENAGVRKVPHAHRVERLIHLELAERRVKKNCEACGKEHREWFEVEATREGLKGVDEVVRRWVDWAENSAGKE